MNLPEVKLFEKVSGCCAMWLMTILCSADSWSAHAVEFNAIAAQYPATLISSKKMKGDQRRIMTYQLEDVGEVEAFQEACTRLQGFTTMFESM
jgi:hypothetical protein